MVTASHRDVERSHDAVEVVNPHGAGDVVFVCEHASNAIPAEFGDLGLGPAALREHIAWDIGAREVAGLLAERFDGPLVASTVSRLVYDCNRPPEAESAVAAQSERFAIPGNAALTAGERQARATRFYAPFRDALRTVLDARAGRSRPPALVTVHSFTAVYLGVPREVEIGILHDADARLADALLAAMDDGAHIARNEPYGPQDGVTHTLREHAVPRGLLNVMIEIRNDLIADAAGVALWAERLGAALAAALAETRRAIA